MLKKEFVSTDRELSDNKINSEDVIDGINLQLPLNRNLSWVLFGQPHNLVEPTSR